MARKRYELPESGLTHGGCMLWIDAVPYLVCRTEAGEAELTTPGGERYIVSRWRCSCPDARFRRHECKHRRQCRAVGLLGEQPVADDTRGA